VSVVRELRFRAGLTQQLLAEASGITAQTISRYETGRKSATLRILDRLAAAVGLRIIVSFAPAETDDAGQVLTLGEDPQPKWGAGTGKP